MSDQSLQFQVAVDADAAIAALAKFDAETKAAEAAMRAADAATKAFEKSQREAVAAVTAIDERIAKYERDMMALGSAILSGKGNTAAYEQELRQLGRELDSLNGKTAATTKKTQEFARAASDVQTHGRNSGLAVLEASRAFEDLQYGIGGVLNNIPNLLMNLGIGAGLTGVVSAAAVGVNMLAKNFGNIDPAAKDATDSAREHVKSLRDEISGLGRDLRALQVGAERAAMEQQAGALMEAQRGFEQAVAPIGGADRFRRLRDNEKLVGTIADKMKIATEAADRLDLEIQKMAAMRRIQQEKEDQKRIDDAVDAANAITEAEKTAGKERIDNAKKLADAKYAIFVADMESEEKQLREAKKASDKRNEEERKQAGKDLADDFKFFDKERKDAEKERNKEAKAVAKERERIAKEEAKEKEKIEKEHQESMRAMAIGGISVVAGATQDYLNARIKGEKDAEAAFAQSIMAQAGQALVGYGTQLLGAAVVSASTGLLPVAAMQGAEGAGLIASGIALGGIAAGIGHTAASGKIGQALPDKESRTDRGASSRSRGGGTSGGGPLVINVSYGVGGPLPEDTAREIAKVMRTGNRRRGAA